MAVKEFDGFVKESREIFRNTLESGFKYTAELEVGLKKMFDECTNDFEEQTLMENLREEFQDYMESLTKGA